MSLDKSVVQIASNVTTRRTIVRTGARLAYAAPAVAVTMKLTASGAGAVSHAECQGSDVVCIGAPGFAFCTSDICEKFAPQPACACSKDTEGNFSCSDICFFSGSRPNCVSSSDCQEAGNVCKEFCGGVRYCVAPCGSNANGLNSAEGGANPIVA